MGDMTTLIDLTPARVDITVTQGDSLTFQLVVKDSDGQPVTLSGTVRAQARRTFKDPEAVAFTVTTASNVATLTLTAGQTVGMLGTWVWDCDYETSGVTTIAAGELKVTPEVRRA
jgi:meiotically up-regulated gene 157 (Mug157) protein